MQRVTLVLLAALCGAAMAREAPTSPAGRELLQSADDCNRAVAHCKTCRYQKFGSGTTTITVCTQCQTGYVPKSGGRACWCAPGYKYKSDTKECVPCNLGGTTFNYCPGSKADITSDPIQCGAGTVTTTAAARTLKECVAPPGFGLKTDGTAEACGAGTYNPGYNARACTKCPGGLTTDAPGTGLAGATSATQCLAPAGYYYYRGKAVACAKGTYKDNLANRDCDKCPTGFTTSKTVGTTTAATDCDTLKAGYAVITANKGARGVAVGTPCPNNTYYGSDRTYTADSTLSCTNCPESCTTNGLVGATIAAQCITPPGYEWNAASSGKCTPCAQGSFNTGYNRELCTVCGTGFTTDDVATVSSDGCKIPAGYGTTRAADGTLSAAKCPVNTFGRGTATYGLVDVECTKCIDNTNTNSLDGRTTVDACVTDVGYGYDDGASNLCDYGYYNGGNNRLPCTYCGDGFNTTTTGSDTSDHCGTAQGWYGSLIAPSPCPKGSFKDYVGTSLDPGTCTSCNATNRGMTTSRPYGAIQTEDCDTCLPGYGTVYTDAQGNIDANGTIKVLGPSVSCTECGSGYYSPGGVLNGQLCSQCDASLWYSGAVMQSKKRSASPDACVPRFITPSSSYTNKAEWDIIPMTGPRTLKSSLTTLKACQDGCNGDGTCQYFEFFVTSLASLPDTSGDGSGAPGTCYWLVAAATIAKVSDADASVITTAPAAFYVMFEVKEGMYVTYVASTGSSAPTIGDLFMTTGASPTEITYSTFADAKAACDGNAECIGIANTAKGASPTWRNFKGAKYEGAVGKVRVVGETINSWIP